MKVKIGNLGVIKEAEIELRPLTIFIGPNNTGKSWLAYTLAAVFGPDGWDRYVRAYAADELEEVYPPIDTAIEQVLAEGNARLDLNQFAQEYGEKYLNNVASYTRRWLRQFLGTKRVLFDHLETHFALNGTWGRFLHRIMSVSLEGKVGGGLFNLLKERGNSTLFFFTMADTTLQDKLPSQAVKEYMIRSVFQALQRALFLDTLVFPAERTTYIALPMRRERSKDGTDIPPEQQLPLMRPVGSLSRVVLGAHQSDLLARQNDASREPIIRHYISLSEILEKEVLAGDLVFSEPDLTGWKELLYVPDGNSVLDMAVTSSMVKELAPLVLYLRYLAEPNALLVIDEPEMNLHPEAQARMMEFLAMLVNAGLHVLITTHSPYFVDHLVNLMKAAEHADKGAIREKFLLGRTEAFIPKEQVSVYLFEKGTARSILDEEGLIDWGTFGDISDYVENLYGELL